MLDSHINRELLARQTLRNFNVNSDFFESLFPTVSVCSSTISRIWLLTLILVFLSFFFFLFNSWFLASFFSKFFSFNLCSFFFSHLHYLCGILLLKFGFMLSLFSLLFCLQFSLLFFDCFFSRLLFLENFNVPSKSFCHNSKSLCFLGKEISFPAHEAKEILKKVVNALALLHYIHKNPVKSFVAHFLTNIYIFK